MSGFASASRNQRAVTPRQDRTKTSSPSTTTQVMVRWTSASGPAEVSISISFAQVDRAKVVAS